MKSPTNMESPIEYFAFNGRDMLVRANDAPLDAVDLQVLKALDLVADDFEELDTGIAAVRLTVTAAEGTDKVGGAFKWIPIRSYFAAEGVDHCFRVSRAKALLEWRALTQFCGRCGTHLVDRHHPTARYCPECGNMIFPRIEPCIIVVITREDGKILLARHVQRNQDIYACIAGFVEAGETLEQAVRREIREETGLEVTNVQYFGSQSWPFPAQLMVGFTAEYAGGDLTLQTDELSDARWFDRDDCPASPRPGSIAYRLIHNIR